MLMGPVQEVVDVIFKNIDKNVIRVRKVSASTGPSGADAEIWQRILCSKHFKKGPIHLCECVVDLAKKLSCKLVDPEYFKAYTTCRLNPLDKKPGVKSIGVSEVLRRIVSCHNYFKAGHC